VQRIVEIHVENAKQRAIRLCGFATSVYPSEWKTPIIEMLTLDALEFGYHARRINEICKIDTSQIDIQRTAVDFPDKKDMVWENNYHKALDRLHHAVEVVFGEAHADHRKTFLNSDANMVPVYLKIKTDRKNEA
jgi:hypothetical protein